MSLMPTTLGTDPDRRVSGSRGGPGGRRACHDRGMSASSAASRDPHLTLRRVERQQRLVELLVRSRRTTAQLATELGVTTRTVERDLARLREVGVPLTSRPGPGGGVRVATRPGVHRVELTTAEIAALLASMAALGPTATDASRTATLALVTALASPEPSQPPVL